MTLSLYLARRFLRHFLIVGATFWAILLLIGIVEEIRRFSAQNPGLGDITWLAALGVPENLYQLLPLIVVLSAVSLFLSLARSSELVVIRASGRSALRMLGAPMAVAFGIGLVAVAVGNPLVSATAKRYETLSERYRAGGAGTVSIGREGVWMRQGAGQVEGGSAQAQAVIHAARANQDATRLEDVTFLIFEPGRGPVRRIEAASARLEPGQWLLEQVRDWPLGASTNPERDALSLPRLVLPSDLTAERIRDSFGKPALVAIWDLPGFIAALEAAGFSARPHLMWLQMELALPFVLVAMVLVAAGFTMGHIRFGRQGMKVLAALAGGLAVFFLRNIAQVLGDAGQIPVALAAWAPAVVALALPLALVLHREDG